VRGIRGWLRAERHPRLTVGLILAACLLLGGALVFLMRWLNVGNFVTRPGLAVLITWPAFLALLRWRAGVEFEALDIDAGVAQFVRGDQVADASRLRAFLDPQSQRSATQQELMESFHREAFQQPLAALLLILFTCGMWLLWDLVAVGPTLLTDLIIDGRLVVVHPGVLQKIPTSNWLKDAAGATAIHFIGLSILTSLLLLIAIIFWEMYR
jgi:hypothetical protein